MYYLRILINVNLGDLLFFVIITVSILNFNGGSSMLVVNMLGMSSRMMISELLGCIYDVFA